MFKKVTFFLTDFGAERLTLGKVQAALSCAPFAPCGPAESLSAGWVPPRGEHEAIAEAVDGHLIAKFMVESKSVPAREVAKWVDAAAKNIEETTGRKPGRKERRALKEDARDALLPKAFPRAQTVFVWFDRAASRIAIGSTSTAVIDSIATSLVRLFDGLQLRKMVTRMPPGVYMMGHLTGDAREAGSQFEVGRECILKADDETKAAIRYKNHNLGLPEVVRHVREGKHPKRLALSTSRASFVLLESGQIDALQLLDVGKAEDAVDAFDGDVTIWTAELSILIDSLTEEMGGLLQVTQ